MGPIRECLNKQVATKAICIDELDEAISNFERSSKKLKQEYTQVSASNCVQRGACASLTGIGGLPSLTWGPSRVIERVGLVKEDGAGRTIAAPYFFRSQADSLTRLFSNEELETEA